MVLVYTTAFCADCHRVKAALAALHVPHRVIDINLDEDGYDDLLRLSPAAPRVPTVVLADGTVLVEPDVPALAARLGGGVL